MLFVTMTRMRNISGDGLNEISMNEIDNQERRLSDNV